MSNNMIDEEIKIAPETIQEAYTQSDFWGEFQEAIGLKVYRFSGKGWTGLCIEKNLPTGKYWILPYGPTVNSMASLELALSDIVTKAKKANCLWLRVEPRLTGGFKPIKGMKKAPRYVEPEYTTMLDLRVDEATLKSRLGKTNRQRINRQERDKTLVLWTSTDPKDIDIFFKMQIKVTKRTGAIFHEQEYLRKQAEVLMPKGHMRLEFAGLGKDKPLAATVIHDYKGTSTYTYAASMPEARELGAANILIWEAMLNAKKRGMKTFDFWGIAPPDSGPNHPWSGFTAFKRSFGTVDVAFAGTWDIPFSLQYYAYYGRTKLVATTRVLKRKLRKRNI